MYCPRCGKQNDDNAEFCSSCGNNLKDINQTPVYNTSQQVNAQYVPNYLAWLIVTTLLCCMPFGIVAIVYSSQVDSKLRNGDYDGAANSSNKAKMWCWIAFGTGILFGIIVIVLTVLAASSFSSISI